MKLVPKFKALANVKRIILILTRDMPGIIRSLSQLTLPEPSAKIWCAESAEGAFTRHPVLAGRGRFLPPPNTHKLRADSRRSREAEMLQLDMERQRIDEERLMLQEAEQRQQMQMHMEGEMRQQLLTEGQQQLADAEAKLMQVREEVLAMEAKNLKLVQEIAERSALYEEKQAEFAANIAQRTDEERADLQASIAEHNESIAALKAQMEAERESYVQEILAAERATREAEKVALLEAHKAELEEYKASLKASASEALAAHKVENNAAIDEVLQQMRGNLDPYISKISSLENLLSQKTADDALLKQQQAELLAKQLEMKEEQGVQDMTLREQAIEQARLAAQELARREVEAVRREVEEARRELEARRGADARREQEARRQLEARRQMELRRHFAPHLMYGSGRRYNDFHPGAHDPYYPPSHQTSGSSTPVLDPFDRQIRIKCVAGDHVPGYRIASVLEAVTGSDLADRPKNDEETDTKVFKDNVEEAKRRAKHAMLEDALRRGANAVIEFDIKYKEITPEIIDVIYTGTAVVIVPLDAEGNDPFGTGAHSSKKQKQKETPQDLQAAIDNIMVKGGAGAGKNKKKGEQWEEGKEQEQEGGGGGDGKGGQNKGGKKKGKGQQQQRKHGDDDDGDDDHIDYDNQRNRRLTDKELQQLSHYILSAGVPNYGRPVPSPYPHVPQVPRAPMAYDQRDPRLYEDYPYHGRVDPYAQPRHARGYPGMLTPNWT